MRKQQQTSAVRALEHLKAFINRTLDAWKTGEGPEQSPITLDIAIAHIWRELEQTLLNLAAMPSDVAWYRISSDDGKLQLKGFVGEVLSLQKLGPRVELHPTVYYLVARSLCAQAQQNVMVLEANGLKVRDFTWGCHRS